MTATLVQLIGGEFVMSDADAWRHECLARHVLNLPHLDQRRAWLADFERRHGPDDADALRGTMSAIHTAGRIEKAKGEP